MNNRINKIIFLYKKATDNDIILDTSSNILEERTKEVQDALLLAGYNLPIYGADGLLGLETYRALLKFKKDNNLPLTKDISEDELKLLKNSKKENLSNITSDINGQTLLFGDSQMQGGIGEVLQAKYGGKRLYKAGSVASYWVTNNELTSELKKKPSRIIIQLNSNGIAGTENLLKKIKEITPSSEIIWYGSPPATLKENSSYSQVKTKESLVKFNTNRKGMNNAVAGMLASSGLNGTFIDPFSQLFNVSPADIPYSCNNCDGIHIPKSIAENYYS